MYDVARENVTPFRPALISRESHDGRTDGGPPGKWIEIRDKCIINDFGSVQQRGCLCLFFII